MVYLYLALIDLIKIDVFFQVLLTYEFKKRLLFYIGSPVRYSDLI